LFSLSQQNRNRRRYGSPAGCRTLAQSHRGRNIASCRGLSSADSDEDLFRGAFDMSEPRAPPSLPYGVVPSIGQPATSTSRVTAAPTRPMLSLHCVKFACFRMPPTSFSSTLTVSPPSQSVTIANIMDFGSGLRRRSPRRVSRSRSTSALEMRLSHRRRRPNIRPCSTIPRRAFAPIPPKP
jgi:hypothetical protein